MQGVYEDGGGCTEQAAPERERGVSLQKLGFW